MKLRSVGLLLLGVPLATAIACGADNPPIPLDDPNTTGSGGSGGGDGGNDTGTPTSSSGQGGGFNPIGSGGAPPAGCEDTDPDTDFDMDGFTENDGDCNDCDANVNPGAIEVATPTDGMGGAGGSGPPEPADEDCDGMVDNVPQACDSGLAIGSTDPMDGARAIELCREASGANDYGVVSAAWVLPNGDPDPGGQYSLGHGILANYGPNVNVQAGASLLALSSGTARLPGDADYEDVGGYNKLINNTGHPVGFPKESPSCGGAVTGSCNDGVALEVELRAPTNATGFRFNFNFYTYEWPVFVCSTYNDFFAAILEPYPMGQSDGNITFDSMGNPISVNNAFFEVCGCSGGPPCQAGGISFACALGESELQGTGYETHAATSWLQTQAPIDGGSTFKVRFTTYDSGDNVLDSTALVDNFEWLAEPGVTVGTEPVPDPR